MLLVAVRTKPVPASVPLTVHCTCVPLPVLNAVPSNWKFAFWPGMNGPVNEFETRRCRGATLASLRTTRQLKLTLLSVVPPRLPYCPTSCGCCPTLVTSTLGSVTYGWAGVAAPAAGPAPNATPTVAATATVALDHRM